MSQGNGQVPQATMELITQALKGVGRVDRRTFKLWEIEDLEEILPGHPVMDVVFGDAPLTTKILRGLLWLRLRRDHPQLAFDDFREFDVGTFEDAVLAGVNEEPDAEEPDAEPDPTNAATVGSGGRGSRQKPSSTTIGG